jgi:Predicted protein-tyrosine phosphatase
MESPLRAVHDGAAMKFQVLGRAHVFTVVPELPHVLISITDVGAPEAALSDAATRLATLRLQFHDADQPWQDRTLLSEEDAQRIVAFVEAHRERVSLVVCQCEAGISRSAGVAAALSKWLNGDDALFFRYFHPNRHVYRLVLEAALGSEPAHEEATET